DREFDTEPSGDAREVVATAFDALARADWDAAEDALAATFESPCERTEPGLSGDQQPVACHLYDDAGSA
ncbi:hypothetical protein PNP03_04520, partial [Halobacterium salinarum]